MSKYLQIKIYDIWDLVQNNIGWGSSIDELGLDKRWCKLNIGKIINAYQLHNSLPLIMFETSHDRFKE